MQGGNDVIQMFGRHPGPTRHLKPYSREQRHRTLFAASAGEIDCTRPSRARPEIETRSLCRPGQVLTTNATHTRQTCKRHLAAYPVSGHIVAQPAAIDPYHWP